jgi:hypothetical protein
LTSLKRGSKRTMHSGHPRRSDASRPASGH